MQDRSGEAGPLAFSPDGARVANIRFDGTVLAWQATPLFDPNALRRDLAGDNVDASQRVLQKMVACPRRSMAYLDKHLPTIANDDARRLRRSLADLDSDSFETREKARRELAKEGEGAESALREALANKPTLELRRRVLNLLDKSAEARRVTSPEDRRIVRAVQVLETIDSTEVRQILKKLSAGAPGALRSREAKAALQRLERRLVRE